MNGHPVFNVVAAQILRVLQDLPGKYKAEIFNWSIVKLQRYRLFELKIIHTLDHSAETLELPRVTFLTVTFSSISTACFSLGVFT